MAHDRQDTGHDTLMARLLVGVTRICCHWPRATLWLVFLTTVGCSLYAWQTLEIKTNRSDLISKDAPYQKRWLKYAEAFGDVTEDIVVVVEGDDRRNVQRAINDLGPRLEHSKGVFRNVLYRIDLRPLAAKGLQFLSDEDLQRLMIRMRRFRLMSAVTPEATAERKSQQLEARAAELGDLSKQVDQLLQGWKMRPNMPPEQRGLLEQQTLELVGMLNSSDAKADEAARTAMIEDARQAQPTEKYLTTDDGLMAFVQAQPVVEPGDLNGASKAVEEMRKLVEVIRKRHPSVTIGMTGVPVLEYEEMKQSQAEMAEASVFSFVGVSVVLFAGFRRMRHPALGMLMLLVGTAWSFAAAGLVVGHLNILSIAFAAMLFGLGNDFAIVYLSHYADMRERGVPLLEALLETSRDVGPGITTAALTAAAAFYAAVLTDFAGIAELGLIAGWGLVLCNILTFIFIPPALMLWDRNWVVEPRPEREWHFGSRRLGAVGLACFLGAMGYFAWTAPQVRYDINLLNMQAEDTEGVDVQKRIEEKTGSLLFAVSLAPDRETALAMKARFEMLPTVGRVEEIASMLPPVSTPERLRMMEEIGRAMQVLSQMTPTVPDPSRIGASLDELQRLMAADRDPKILQAAQGLDRFLDELSSKSLPDQMRQLSSGLVSMPPEYASLSNPRSREPVTLKDLPESFVSRNVTKDDRWLLKVYPKEAVWDEKPLEAFVKDLRTVDPEVTGTPLQNLEASRAIWDSYLNAGLYALIAVLALLIWDFRTWYEPLLAMLPAASGLLATLGILGRYDIPLNQANMIMLPLLLGLGVDGGVHVLHDYRLQKGNYRISFSTVRAIVLTASTSIIGFGSLMIASHRGLFSLGLVLTVGVTGAMLTSLIALPSLLVLVTPNRKDEGADGLEVPGHWYSPGAAEPESSAQVRQGVSA